MSPTLQQEIVETALAAGTMAKTKLTGGTLDQQALAAVKSRVTLLRSQLSSAGEPTLEQLSEQGPEAPDGPIHAAALALVLALLVLLGQQ